MKIGFLFPGQGSQFSGMGKDLYEKYKCVRDIYNKVKDITGIDVAEISFSENDDRLNQTKYTQICVLTMSLGIAEILKNEGINAQYSAGLSLGEYSALIYSHLFKFEDGIKIVEKRGTFMSDYAPKGNWAMAAIIGLDDEVVEIVCKQANSSSGFVVPVNYNCKGQVVISGELVGVQTAGEIAKQTGARKVVFLNTSGPFHTEKLAESADLLEKELRKINYQNMDCKVIKNLDGEIYSQNDDFSSILMKHIISPVRFSKCLQTMIDEGIDTFVEIGPGKSLSGFVKRMKTDKEIKILNICDVESLEKALSILKNN